jgi:hypothetical protein
MDAAREAIAKLIAEDLRYDVHVGLIAVAHGGYNISLTNRRKRDDVRGLVDPSFIAFSLAGYTTRTNWRSRNIQIWLDPYREGWTLPTSGSRRAVRKGKEASELGFLGVVDIPAYRKWLEKAFRRLESPIDP